MKVSKTGSAHLRTHPSRSPAATSSNLPLTSFTRSTCASTSPLFLILIAARATRANSYDRETETSIAVSLAAAAVAVVVGRGVETGPAGADAVVASTAARSTLDARRMARSRSVSSRASGGAAVASFLLVFAALSFAAAAFVLDPDDMDMAVLVVLCLWDRAVRHSLGGPGPPGLRCSTSGRSYSSRNRGARVPTSTRMGRRQGSRDAIFRSVTSQEKKPCGRGSRGNLH